MLRRRLEPALRSSSQAPHRAERERPLTFDGGTSG